jgi:flagellar FliJ protein
MTAFRFRLQRVLDFRRTQLQLAESSCRNAAAKLHGIQAQQAALVSRKSETRKAFARMSEVDAADLASLPVWYQWTVRASEHLIHLERSAELELQKQRNAVLEAQRKVRLLEKLRDRRQANWQLDYDCELEALAADATNSRLSK